ncbi:ATP-binding cassette domain-containing protein [Corynebacterium sp. H128]|uniref:ABC transporter ATP-binding protein n=1 Tax=unclassified Corynebacterium TaxID=2624378 RepID=UPI0030B7ABDB
MTKGLTAIDIAVAYADFSDVSLLIPPGQLVGLAGPSGSGKTTIARVLAGKMKPTSGRVLIDGHPVSTTRRRRTTAIATINQSPRAACNPRWTLGEIIAEPLLVQNLPLDVTAFAAAAQLGEDLLERTPDQVSDGQLQRACIARAMAQGARYVICDEPTSALDPLATAAVVKLLRAQTAAGVGVLFISHDQRLLTACADQVLRMEDLVIGSAGKSFP